MEIEEIENQNESDDEEPEKSQSKPIIKSSTLQISTHTTPPQSPSLSLPFNSVNRSSASSSSFFSSPLISIPESTNVIVKPSLSPERISQLQLLEENLGPEPAENQPGITTIVLRLPSGENLQRRFFISTQFQKLKDFVQIQALPKNGNKEIPENFYFVTDYPRVELKDMAQTLSDAKLVAKKCNLRVTKQ